MPSFQRPYLDLLRAHLPAMQLAEVDRVAQQEDVNRALETVLAFALGSSCPKDSPGSDDRDEWRRKQVDFRNAQVGAVALSTKRPLEDASDSADSQSAPKKPKADVMAEAPVCTLHAISASAPVRKKVDVTITESSIQLCPPSKATPSSEAPFLTVRLASIRRAFLIPTRGKSKPHWTVVLLTSDAPPETPKGKAKATSTATPDPNREIVFGLDADAPSPVTYTAYINGQAHTKTIAKGQPTMTALEELLAHLPTSVVRPSAAIFRPSFSSATKSRPAAGPSASSGDGQDDMSAAVDAHRGAKSGSLWFLESGLLWTDARPVEFWALEDIVPPPNGVRTLSATGRTCSVFVMRRVPRGGADNDGEDEDEDMDAQEEGIETEFATIDGKEQDAIANWTRRFEPRFGKNVEELNVPDASAKGKGKATAPKPATGNVTILDAAWDDDDDDDEDFEGSDDSDAGEDVGEDDAADSEASGEEENDEEAAGDGASADSDEEDAENDAAADEEEEEELDPAHHPLLRPGAMPKRVSKAVVDMVVGMVTEEMLGGNEDEEDELEEDELEE
jgi:hypothetical protein